MSSKADELENQQDQVTELSHFKKFESYDERDELIKVVKTLEKFATNTVMTESSKTPREKINIEIDIFQRTAVFSSDFSMWI